MNISTKLLKAAAGAAGGAGLDVDEVFSTFLYTGDGTDNRAISNGIDLSGEGGLVWIKNRDFAFDHLLGDTERGITKGIRSNTTAAENNFSDRIKTVTSTGFTLGTADEINSSNTGYTGSLMDYVSWTFRKAPKFFDVVTYSGTGSAQNISHSLGSVPGMIIIKHLTYADNWYVYHRATDASAPEDYHLELNATAARTDDATVFNDTAPTSTQFTVGTNDGVNKSGSTYVAYLFAHNNSDGEFGPDSDQDIIKCGSFSTDSSGNATINLGFEPQFVMNKVYDAADNWTVADNMRGFNAIGDQRLYWNLSNAEATATTYRVTSTGFTVNSGETSKNFIYMAIRRGPLAAPEDATKVFAIDSQGSTGDGNAPSFRSNFPVDMAIRLDTSGASKDISARLTGATRLYTDLTNAESSFNKSKWDYQNGWYSATTTITNYYAHMWKRAPSYFDAVAYTGTGSPNNGYRDVTHNLGVQPEMMWLKRRDSTSEWTVNHKDAGAGYLNLTNSFNAYPRNGFSHNDAFTATTFSAKAQDEWNFNVSGANYIAYLFATVAGVSKVGSYTGDSSDGKIIDCGFTSGAKFVLIKCTTTVGDWFVFDSVRGIVEGNDPKLALNNTDAEVSVYDYVEPHSSGFKVNTIGSAVNGSGKTFIFYAIA